MDANEKYEIITKNLQEVVGEDKLKEILNQVKIDGLCRVVLLNQEKLRNKLVCEN